MKITYTYEAAMRKVITAVALKHKSPPKRAFAIKSANDIDNKFVLTMDKKDVAEIWEVKGTKRQIKIRMNSIDGFAQRMAEFVGSKLEEMDFDVTLEVNK